MKKLFFILIIMSFACFQQVYAQRSIYSDEIIQLRNVNDELHHKLSNANKEIRELQKKKDEAPITENIIKELEKAKKDLANQSCEIRMLREKLMIVKDYDLNGE